MPRRRDERRRARGPYKHGNRWRVVVVAPGGEATPFSYPTKGEADAVVRDYQREFGTGSDVDSALARWQADLETEGLMPVTVETLMRRSRMFLAPVIHDDLRALTPKRCEALYKALRKRCAVQTHHLALSETRRFTRWCVAHGLLTADPTAKLKRVGKPNRGKPKLRVTESRALVDVAIAEAAKGDESAVAVLIALVLGRRASETKDLATRDVDDGGALLWVSDAKTEAGKVVIEVPLVMRPILNGLVAARKKAKQKGLFPGRSRYWVYYHTLRLCRLAGVPEVCPHGLRGTHATLATQTGATAEMVTRAMGWTSISVGERHYFERGTVDRARTGRAAQRLLGHGKAS
jgi:integrase